MPSHALMLEVAEFTDVDNWRWILKDAQGAFLADHTATLQRTDPKYWGLYDLQAYLRYHTAPDKREEDERRLSHDFGAWVAKAVLGKSIAEAIVQRCNPTAIVRVIVPPSAEHLLLLPLELAHVGDEPIGLHGAALVFQVAGDAPLVAAPIRERLRFLALFSLPPVGSALNLRRERHALQALVRELVGASGLSIDLRVLQYGVTRDGLLEALTSGEGWDIVHFSGHGVPGSLLLETPEGEPDQISAADMADLLRQSGQQLKLVVLSACQSAATNVGQTLANLDIETKTKSLPNSVKRKRQSRSYTPSNISSTARAVVGSLDCAVVGMRYALDDEFASTFTSALYDGLLRHKQLLPAASQRALHAALRMESLISPATDRPLSIAMPVLFGRKATELTLTAPALSEQNFSVQETSLAYFPSEADHFVGRVRTMTQASAALAVCSKKSGILLHGMAGAGKTSCAIELANHHGSTKRFKSFVWYQAPEQGKDIGLEMRNCALAMERQLPGLAMIHVVDNVQLLKNWLPKLSQMLAAQGVLIVFDNLEALLTDKGQWRDERWSLLIEALTGQKGLSRIVLTSRVRPVQLSPTIDVIPVHALTRDEAIILVRELPNLRRLLDGKADGYSRGEGRDLLRTMLRLVQGHPKLIEFAERLAAEPNKLADRLERAKAMATSGTRELDAFFEKGETRFLTEDFLATLRNWTRGIARGLSASTQRVFSFLCALEEGDRQMSVIESSWPQIWEQLRELPPAPNVESEIMNLLAVGLIDERLPDSLNAAQHYAPTLIIHPAVAEYGRADAGSVIQGQIDAVMAAFWYSKLKLAVNEYGKESWAGPLTVRAGLAALPYLNRTCSWDVASTVVERVYNVDSSQATTAALMPMMRRIVTETSGTERERIDKSHLAHLLRVVGLMDEAEKTMRANLKSATDCGDFRVAGKMCNELAQLLRDTGRLNEALGLAVLRTDYSERAGSSWDCISGKLQQLQILNAQGKYEVVLERVRLLQEEMESLPKPGEREATLVCNLRETILDTASAAATRLGDKAAVEANDQHNAEAQAAWEASLNFETRLLQSRVDRGAPLLELAQTRFNAHIPLMRLKRYVEARKLLDSCRGVFENEKAIPDIGRVLAAFGSLERCIGNIEEAMNFQKAALRYVYVSGVPDEVAAGHFNLASRILEAGGALSEAFAHRLAAILLGIAIASGRAEPNLATFRLELKHAGTAGRSALPSTFSDLCASVENVAGVKFGQIMQILSEGRGDELLRSAIVRALEDVT